MASSWGTSWLGRWLNSWGLFSSVVYTGGGTATLRDRLNATATLADSS